MTPDEHKKGLLEGVGNLLSGYQKIPGAPGKMAAGMGKYAARGIQPSESALSPEAKAAVMDYIKKLTPAAQGSFNASLNEDPQWRDTKRAFLPRNACTTRL
jgi:hypothetical protein